MSNKPRLHLFSASLLVLAASLPGTAQDLTPPSVPMNLTATAGGCGQINLSWNASTDNSGGSGLNAYVITRSDGSSLGIGSARTTFTDTNLVKSGATLSYTVAAQDTAGNRSAGSNTASATTPVCAPGPGELLVDDSTAEPLGKSIATYNYRSAILYKKANSQNLTPETWISVRDADTGQSSRFLLHSYPGYYQAESDYVLTSATELWTVSYDSNNSGKLLASQYRLIGTPPTSATLLSTKALGDSLSWAKSMIRLESGALVIAWNQETWGSVTDSLTTGYAYRSPTGVWTVNYPVTIPNSGGGNIALTQMILAQHPTDKSIWAFLKRDSFHDISALHFTENSAGMTMDWIQPDYISTAVDGANGPEGEFPFLAAAPDASRSAILLAYQARDYRIVFADPLLNSMNGIFLKEAPVAIAQIATNGSKTFLPQAPPIERAMQFGLSVIADGTIWLSYQPIDGAQLKWSEVYTRRFTGGAWEAPALVATNFHNYNVPSAERDPGLLIFGTDQPVLAFRTPDQKVRSFTLTNAAPTVDSSAPVTAITTPTTGSTASGSMTVAATATDNVGVTTVEFWVDGVLRQSKSTGPYSFVWDASSSGPGSHSLQTRAYDAAGNQGTSPTTTVNVVSTTPTVAITSPGNGSTVTRNKTIAITATATDGSGIASVAFYVNNTLIGTDTAAPYTVNWKVPAKSGATYEIKAVAKNSLGVTASAAITVTGK